MIFCRREQFVQWVEGLSDAQTPSWLGLPNNAEKVLLTNKGTILQSSLLAVFDVWLGVVYLGLQWLQAVLLRLGVVACWYTVVVSGT